MLPKRQRLTHKDFPLIVMRGGTAHGKYFTLRALDALPGATTGARVSCVVSKKVAAKAVVRNHLKRQTMASVRGFLKKHPSPLPYTVALFAKKEALVARATEREAEVFALLSSLS